MPPVVIRGSHDVVLTNSVGPDGTLVVSDDAALCIEIPAGATSDWFVLVRDGAPLDPAAEAPEGLVLAWPVLQLSTSGADGGPVVLARPAHVVLQYADGELEAAGLDEGTLALRLQDPATGVWADVVASVDVVANQIVFDAVVLGPMAAFAAPFRSLADEPALDSLADEAAEPPTDEQAGEPPPDEGNPADAAEATPGVSAPSDEDTGTLNLTVGLASPPQRNPAAPAPASRPRLVTLPGPSDRWTVRARAVGPQKRGPRLAGEGPGGANEDAARGSRRLARAASQPPAATQ